MNYKLKTLPEVTLVGKTFEFPTSEIQTVDYSKYYSEVCGNMHPELSYGIYEVGTEITKFTVAIKTNIENDFDKITIHGGDFYEFTIDFMENMKENQYVKCFDALANDNIEFDMSYSVEIMDKNMDFAAGKTEYKYYLKK